MYTLRMADPITFRPTVEDTQNLAILTEDGTSPTHAIRHALEIAAHSKRQEGLRADAARLAANPDSLARTSGYWSNRPPPSTRSASATSRAAWTRMNSWRSTWHYAPSSTLSNRQPPTSFQRPVMARLTLDSPRIVTSGPLTWENGADDGNRTRTVSLGS
jgi:hypothetical protein